MGIAVKPERWQTVKELFEAAIERGAEERTAFLNQACAGDESLRLEVEGLIVSYEQDKSFMERPAVAAAAHSFLGDHTPSLIGKSIGSYKIVGEIGRGGMGEVYLAEDSRLGRQVALKLLPAKFTADSSRVRRFAQEARAASALNHPNIITIHEIGEAPAEAGGTHYIVTEYVEGETLRQLMSGAPQQRMKPSEAVDVAAQIAAALSAAHEAGIMHRDIKPENVMVRRDGIVKVLDFGLAKLTEAASPVIDTQASTLFRNSTEAGVVMGTPRYMSPEQARGEKVDARTDIFSLGVMLYEMVAGRAPFAGATTGEVIAAILRDSPPPLAECAPDAPPEMERILSKALRKNRDERYQTVNELLVDLKRLKRQLEQKDELKDELARAGQPAPEGEVPASGEATLHVATLKQAESTDEVAPARTTAKHWAGGLRRGRLIAVCALAVVVAGLGWIYWRNAKLSKARAAIAQIEELAQAERFFEAYDLAVEEQRYLPNDPTITRLMPTIADDLSVVTDPPGAQVYLKRFAPDESGNFPARQLIGATPINHRQIARGAYRVSIEKEGYGSLERTVSGVMMRLSGLRTPSPPVRLEAKLMEAAKVPARMAFVPGGDYRLVSYERPTTERVRLDAYFIDKYEVTNREYKEFISAGGYLKREYWRHLISSASGSERSSTTAPTDRATIATARSTDSSWEAAIREFKDRTGLPGPRSWANQDFPEGQAEHPVTDISWYEAAAYAAFRGKELPTIFQWEKAARDGLAMVAGYVMPWGLFTGTVEGRANFDGRGTMPVESLEFGLSPYGCYHMAGNVNEWCRNKFLEGFASAGGSWAEPPHLFGYYGAYPGSYSSGKLGFRCVLNAPGATGDQGAMPLLAKDQVPVYKPASEASFRAWQGHYRYAQTPLDAQIVEVKETDDWRREKITYAGAEGERAIAYLYLPKRYPPPWQVIQYIPHGAVFRGLRSMPDAVEASQAPFIKSGRAVLAVVLKGFPEREWPPNRTPPSRETVEYRDQILHWMADERRGLDYATTRSDLDVGRVAYLSISSDSSLKLDLPAIETRYRSVILHGAALNQADTLLLPEIHPVNLVPYIRAPKLLLHGRYDEGAPLKSQGEPMQKLMRGPKRIVLYDGGHAVPAEVFVPAINAWLDETMGPVRRQ
jgi:eukaryotic-like serine/threonine-protein kinase